MKNTGCAIVLVRVSTAIQNFEPQIADLIRYAEKMGYTDLHKVETKESGLADISDKEGFEKLKSFIKNNPHYNTIFATELSRIGRRQSVLHQIKEWLISNKIQLYLKDTGYSLFDSEGNISAAGEIMFTLFGYFAESELKTKKDRFQRAKKHLMSLGLSISGKTLFGYKKQMTSEGRNTLVLDEENSVIVKKLFSWYLSGYENKQNPSIRDISVKCLKENFPLYTHSKRNVNKLLKEEGYTGFKITNNKRKNPNHNESSNEEKYIVTKNQIKYPEIIEKGIFDAVQQKLKENNTNADKSSKHLTLLARLIICPSCGNFFTADYRIYNNISKNSFRCGGRNKTIPCENKQVISMSMMNTAVWSIIKTDLDLLSQSINEINPDKNIKTLKASESNIKNRLQSIESEIAQLQKSLISATAHRNVDLSGLISAFESRIIKLSKEKQNLQKEAYQLENQFQIAQKRLMNVEAIITDNIDAIENSQALLRRYITYFVKNIEILNHNKRFTTLCIHFRTYAVLEKKIVHPDGRIEKPDNEYGPFTFVLLDKRRTLDIKAIKITRAIQVLQDDKIKASQIIPIVTLFDMTAEALANNPIYKDMRRFELTKLKLPQ